MEECSARTMSDANISNYLTVEKLRDGRPVTIRAIRATDKELIREAFGQLEDESVRLRFFGPKKELTDQELIWATEVDFVRNVALLAIVLENESERVIGVGRYIVHDDTDPPSIAEVAFVVEEDYQGQGIASTLFRHLVLIGRKIGISRFEAEVLPANRAMLRVFERSGLPIATKATSDSILVSISIDL